MLETIPENFKSRTNLVLEIFIHKVPILDEKWPKWCPKITLYLEHRKCYGKSDLIFGIYEELSFTSVSSNFSLLVSSGWKFDPKTVNFECLFEWFLGIFSAATWSMWMKLGQKSDQMDTNQIQGHTIIHRGDFRVKYGQNQPKSTKLNEWSNFFSRSRTILTKFLNGLIRKIIMLKVKFGDPHEELPHKRSPWLQTWFFKK